MANQLNDEPHRQYLTPEEAVTLLGLTPPQFESLRKQYGIGRYNFPRERDQFMFDLEDIERLKKSLPSAG